MKRYCNRLLIFASLLILGASGVAHASPIKQLKAAQAKLNSLAMKNASDPVLKVQVNRLLDYDQLAQNVLRLHWGKLTPAQKKEFRDSFRALLEKNYIKGIRKNAKYTIVYKRESVSGGSAQVETQVNTVRKGRPREVAIVYKMRRFRGRWVVNDVITDDVSMERNYRKSFNRIIKDKGFDELIRKLKKKANATP